MLTAPMYTMLSTTHTSTHAMYRCYCWLYPCTPCCPLHTHQHMLCIAAIVDFTHVHHVGHYTHINTCYVLLLLLTAPMYTMSSTTHTSTHAMYCCFCWLHPCTPCCPLHTHQHMLCIAAIVDCTHVHHFVHYTHINTCYVLLLLLTAPMYTMLSKISEHTIPCCYCWPHPYRVSYSFLRGHGDIV